MPIQVNSSDYLRTRESACNKSNKVTARVCMPSAYFKPFRILFKLESAFVAQ